MMLALWHISVACVVVCQLLLPLNNYECCQDRGTRIETVTGVAVIVTGPAILVTNRLLVIAMVGRLVVSAVAVFYGSCDL